MSDLGGALRRSGQSAALLGAAEPVPAATSQLHADLDADLDAAAEAIAASPSLALACHHTPDGDALGSMLALLHLSRLAGKAAVASWPEPFVVGPHYKFLPDLDEATKPADFPGAPDVMVTFDCASLERLGELAPAARAARQLIVIDHHLTNDGYGTVNLIDDTAAATAVVVRRLLRRLGWPLDQDAAVCLYTGLVCDTGRFQYENTTPEVFALAQELSAFDLAIPAITRQLFEEHRADYLRLMGTALSRVVLDRERRFVATWVTADDLAEHGVMLEETEGLIDLVRRTVEADVSCVLKETPDGTKVSLRAVSEFDVSAVATHFGGGGHRSRAAFVIDRPVAEVLAAIRDVLPDVSNEPADPKRVPAA